MKRPRIEISWKTMSLRTLRKLAALLGISGRSAMSKQQLTGSLRKQMRASKKAESTVAAAIKQSGVAHAPASTSKPAAPPPPPPPAPRAPAVPYIDRGRPIPDAYGSDTLRLMPRDPEWLFVYWELTPHRLRQLRSRFIELHEKPWHIRLHDMATGTVHATPVFLGACNWYLQVKPRGAYRAELGFMDGDVFVAVLTSNTVKTPGNAISERGDEHWMVLKRDLLRMLHLGHEADLFGPERPIGSAERFKEVTREQIEILEKLAEEARTLGASGGASSSARAQR
jgi:hypothetical protein